MIDNSILSRDQTEILPGSGKRKQLALSGYSTFQFSCGLACVVGRKAESDGAGLSVDITAGEGVLVFADIISETLGGAR